MRVVVEADGGSRGNPGPAGYGAVVRDAASGEVLVERAAGIGSATNNVAEYGGLVAGLKAALELGADEVEVRMDSKLVVEQMSGRWQVKNEGLRPLAREAAGLASRFRSIRFQWIPRERNKAADALANAAMDAQAQGREWQSEPVAVPEGGARQEPAEAPVPNRLSGWQEAPGPPTTTLLLRHGQTAMSVEKRFSGSSDPALTPLGEAQAAAAAERLAGSGAVAVVASPRLRTRQTAAPIAAALGVDVDVLDGLAETDFGDWEGCTFAEVRERWPHELDAWLADTSVPPPHGESFDATARRVRAALVRVVATYGGQPVVVVSHVTPVKTLVRMALEAPPQALYRMHLDLASLSEVQWFPDGPAVVRSFNDTGHLSGVG